MAKKNGKGEGRKKKKKIVLKGRARPAGVLEVEDVLRKVNYIQVERESVKFKVTIDDAPVVENILRDAGLIVTKTSSSPYVTYEVEPGEPIADGSSALEGIEELSDEVPEDGQIFD